MARKVNLQALIDNGDLTPDLLVGSEDATSDGLGVLFDGDENTFKLVVNQTLSTEQLRLNFSPTICKDVIFSCLLKLFTWEK